MLDRLGKCAVAVRIVTRHDKVFRAHFFNDVDSRFFVGIERDVTLALEVLARRHRQLMLAAGPELLPLVVKPPQPPVDPAGRPFKERTAQLRVAFKNAAGSHAGDSAHQFDRVADGMSNRVKIGVADITRPGIVLKRTVAGWMKADRHIEPFELVP